MNEEFFVHEASFLQALHELTQNMAKDNSVDGVVHSLATSLRQLGKVDRVILTIIDGAGNADVWEVVDGNTRVRTSPVRGSSLEQVVKTGKEYVDNQIGRYSDFFDERELAAEGYLSYLSLPLVAENAVFGALGFATKRDGAFKRREMTELGVLSNLAGQIVRNKLMSRKLDEAERITQLLFEKSADVSFVVDQETGKVVGANKDAEKATGYREQELVGMSINSFFNLGGDRSLTERIRAGDFGEKQIVRFTCKNGLNKFLEMKHETITVGGRNLSLLACNDVTDKLTVESDYKDVVESISDIVVSIDGRGEISTINEEVSKVLGYDRENLIGRPFGTLVYESDFREIGMALQALQDGKEAVRGLEIRLRDRNGETKYFEMNAHAYHDASGELIKITGVLKDIDKEKKAHHQAEVVANVVENSSDSIYCTDKMGLIYLWNKGAEKIFGYKKEEMMGRNVSVLYPQNEMAALNDLITRLNRVGSITGVEGVRLKKGGEPIYVSVSANVVRNDDGKVEGYMEILQDKTAKQKMEENEKIRKRLEEKNKQLIELNEMKSVFVSNVSHELRTPLTSIHGYSALMKEGMAGDLSDKQSEYINIIHNETERLTRLINDLLDLSRIDSGKIRLQEGFFDVRDMVGKCSCISLAEKKGLYVKWNISDEVLQVYGDPSRIAQVFINLISNAIKFTEAGGVTINITKKSPAFIQVEVVDTGIGIAEEDQKHLFKRFYQVNKKGEPKRQGTGLGLTISREIIKLHGGRITIESEVGKGTKFTFTLRSLPTRKQRKRMKKPMQVQP